jgi:hypothetical protein
MEPLRIALAQCRQTDSRLDHLFRRGGPDGRPGLVGLRSAENYGKLLRWRPANELACVGLSMLALRSARSRS